MKKKSVQLLLISGTLLFIAACQKGLDTPLTPHEEISSASNRNTQKEKKKIYVSSLDELYAAVNNPGNAGTEVVIDPGNYVLNASYPNGGRLELQTNMSLRGQPGQVDAVLIDESALPNSSFFLAPGLGTGGIRMGRSANNLEWLTLKGGSLAVNPFSTIEIDLPSTETFIGISHVKVLANGNRIGIAIRNRLAEHSGRKIHAELNDNEITGAVTAVGFGVNILNFNGATNSSIYVTMNQNYIHGNRVGIIAGNAAAFSPMQNSTIKIESYADKLEGNGCGLDPSAGVCQNAPNSATHNMTTIEMHGTVIEDNNPSGMPQLTPVNGALPGGIYATCAYNALNNINGYNLASNNTMKLSFYGCHISNNNGTDINAFAAWCSPATVLAGSNNLLEIYLHGISADATVAATASSPAEPVGTNVLNIHR